MGSFDSSNGFSAGTRPSRSCRSFPSMTLQGDHQRSLPTKLLYSNADDSDADITARFTQPPQYVSHADRPLPPEWALPISSSTFSDLAERMENAEAGIKIYRLGMVAFTALVAVEAFSGRSIVEFLHG